MKGAIDKMSKLDEKEKGEYINCLFSNMSTIVPIPEEEQPLIPSRIAEATLSPINRTPPSNSSKVRMYDERAKSSEVVSSVPRMRRRRVVPVRRATR